MSPKTKTSTVSVIYVQALSARRVTPVFTSRTSPRPASIAGFLGLSPVPSLRSTSALCRSQLGCRPIAVGARNVGARERRRGARCRLPLGRVPLYPGTGNETAYAVAAGLSVTEAPDNPFLSKVLHGRETKRG